MKTIETIVLCRFSILAVVLLFTSNIASAQVALTLTTGKTIHADRLDIDSPAKCFIIRSKTLGISIARTLHWYEVESIDIRDNHFDFSNVTNSADKSVDKPASIVKTTFDSASSHPDFRSKSQAVQYSKNLIASKTNSEQQSSGDNVPESAWERYSQVETGICSPWWNGCYLPTMIPTRSIVVGVRDDPLQAYHQQVKRFYPNGVPVNEAPVVLDLMRAHQAQKVLSAEPIDQNTPTDQAPIENHKIPVPIPHVPSPKSIRALSTDAAPISSNGRVDWDSLLVQIEAVDQFGQPAPVQGTLSVTLWGRSQELIRSYGRDFFSNPRQIRKLATWTNNVRNSAPIVLPLPKPLPDHNSRVFPTGELHVQLLVPGQGTFEAIQRNVILKHLGPLRNQLLTETGSRLFPREGTYDSRRPSGIMFRETSSFRPESAIFTVKP